LRVLAHRFQHPVAHLLAGDPCGQDQRVVHEQGQPTEHPGLVVASGNRLDGVEVEAPREHRQPLEHPLGLGW
jgi:hypothetical protein